MPATEIIPPLSEEQQKFFDKHYRSYFNNVVLETEIETSKASFRKGMNDKGANPLSRFFDGYSLSLVKLSSITVRGWRPLLYMQHMLEYNPAFSWRVKQRRNALKEEIKEVFAQALQGTNEKTDIFQKDLLKKTIQRSYDLDRVVIHEQDKKVAEYQRFDKYVEQHYQRKFRRKYMKVKTRKKLWGDFYKGTEDIDKAYKAYKAYKSSSEKRREEISENYFYHPEKREFIPKNGLALAKYLDDLAEEAFAKEFLSNKLGADSDDAKKGAVIEELRKRWRYYQEWEIDNEGLDSFNRLSYLLYDSHINSSLYNGRIFDYFKDISSIHVYQKYKDLYLLQFKKKQLEHLLAYNPGQKNEITRTLGGINKKYLESNLERLKNLSDFSNNKDKIRKKIDNFSFLLKWFTSNPEQGHETTTGLNEINNNESLELYLRLTSDVTAKKEASRYDPKLDEKTLSKLFFPPPTLLDRVIRVYGESPWYGRLPLKAITFLASLVVVVFVTPFELIGHGLQYLATRAENAPKPPNESLPSPDQIQGLASPPGPNPERMTKKINDLQTNIETLSTLLDIDKKIITPQAVKAVARIILSEIRRTAVLTSRNEVLTTADAQAKELEQNPYNLTPLVALVENEALNAILKPQIPQILQEEDIPTVSTLSWFRQRVKDELLKSTNEKRKGSSAFRGSQPSVLN